MQNKLPTNGAQCIFINKTLWNQKKSNTPHMASMMWLLKWLLTTFLWLLVTLMTMRCLACIFLTFACCSWPSKELTVTQTLLELILRGHFSISYELRPACLVTFFLTMPVTLVLFGLGAKLSTAMWLWQFAALWIRLFTHISDAAALQKVPLHLLAWDWDGVKAFPACKVAPVVWDHNVVKKHTIIFNDVSTDGSAGYTGFLALFSLVRGEYGEAWLQMKFLQKSQQCHITSYKYDYDIRPPMPLGLFQ